MKVTLVKNTGITPGNYKYWESQSACDSWFKGKGFHTEEVNIVRIEPPSKYGHNVGCVHLSIKAGNVADADYILIEDERLWKCVVVSREYVNPNSTRIYFTPDYVATFWGDIKIGKSFVERTHVKEEKNQKPSMYNLAEPFMPACVIRPDLAVGKFLDKINNHLNMNSDKAFVAVSATGESSEMDTVSIKWNAGVPVAGVVVQGDESKINDFMRKAVSFTWSIIDKNVSTVETINSLFYCPKAVAESTGKAPVESGFESPKFIGEVIKDPPAVQFNKIYNLFTFRIIGNNGTFVVKGSDLINNVFSCEWFMTGGSGGAATLICSIGGAKQFLYSHPWPQVSVGGVNRPIRYTPPTMPGPDLSVTKGLGSGVSQASSANQQAGNFIFDSIAGLFK